MPGPFDTAANMGDPYAAANTGGISPFLSPAYHRWSSIADTLGGMSQALVAASAPSPYPQDFGTVFGALGAGAARAGAGFEDRQLKRALTGSQVAMANQKIQQYLDWRKLFGGGDATPPPSPSADATNPGAPAPTPTGKDFNTTLAAGESGGNYSIPNAQGSGAYGKYQFMPDTWAGVATAHPELNLPFNMKQATPQQQEAAQTAFTADNSKILTSAGIQPTPSNLALAHWVGAEGAKKVLAADPNTPVGTILGAAVLEKNPGLRVTAGQLVAGLNERYQGVAAPQAAPGAVPGVTPAQYSPPVQQPKTFAQTLQSVPPGVRAMIAAMGPEAGMKELLKYADPESVPAQDARTGQIVFAPKTALGSGQYIPLDASKLGLDREKFGFEKEKFATEQKQAGEWVRGTDGKERWVQKAQLSPGMERTDKPPDPGSETGDVGLLKHGQDNPAFVKTPEYAAAYNRRSEPKMSQQGQLQYPDMSAYPKPGGGGESPGGTRFEDTPSSRFQMSRQLREEMTQIQSVKDWRAVAPIYESMKEAQGRNNKAADLNLVYGFAKIMDPGSVVREGEIAMAKGVQSLPDWVRSNIDSMVSGKSGLSVEARRVLMEEAASRVGAVKQQYDTIASHYSSTAKKYGLDSTEIVNSPATTLSEPAGKAPQAAAPTFDFKPGQGLVPR